MPEYITRDDAMPEAYLERLRMELARSIYVGDSPLAGTFSGSRGFSVTFKRPSLAQVVERFEVLKPYLELVLAPESYTSLFSLGERLRRTWAKRPPNAFFLNLLLMGPGDSVGPHVDATLRDVAEVDDVVPKLVSVLYIDGDAERIDGRLRLLRSGRLIADLAPRTGTLVHFRGDLTHEVTPISEAAEGWSKGAPVRASLVCEQYHFGSEALERVPALHVKSRGLFGRVLERSKASGIREFQLD